MRVYKPFVLITTPLALAWGIYEGFRLAGAVAVIIILQVLILTVAFVFVLRKMRKEKAKSASPGGFRQHDNGNRTARSDR